MRDMHYKNKNFRLSENLYEDLRINKPKDMTWNQFVSQLLKEWKKLSKRTELEK